MSHSTACPGPLHACSVSTWAHTQPFPVFTWAIKLSTKLQTFKAVASGLNSKPWRSLPAHKFLEVMIFLLNSQSKGLTFWGLNDHSPLIYKKPFSSRSCPCQSGCDLCCCGNGLKGLCIAAQHTEHAPHWSGSQVVFLEMRPDCINQALSLTLWNLWHVLAKMIVGRDFI